MRSILSNREDSTVWRSSKELKQCQLNVYTQPAGLIGSLIGRALKFEASSFRFFIRDRKTPQLLSVEVDASSLEPTTEVNERKMDRVALLDHEVYKLHHRVRDLLSMREFPLIRFVVTKEDSESLEGDLTLRDQTRPIRCLKKVEGVELVTTCMVKYTDFGVPVYQHLFGAFRVHDVVEVESRVPLTRILQ
jgi:hypothetical protein